MGYKTRYEIKVHPENGALLAAFLKESDEFQYAEDGEPVCWYDHEQETQSITSKFPDCVVSITGKGEEPGDIWRKAFLNGEKVWEWRMDAAIPDVPAEILDMATAEPRNEQGQTKAEEIAALKVRLAELEGGSNDIR